MEHSIQELEVLGKDFHSRMTSCELVLQNTDDSPISSGPPQPPVCSGPTTSTHFSTSHGHRSDRLTTDGSAAFLCDVDAFWSAVKCQVNQSSGTKQNPQTLVQKGHLLMKKWKTIVGCVPKAQLFALEEELKSPNAWVECL